MTENLSQRAKRRMKKFRTGKMQLHQHTSPRIICFSQIQTASTTLLNQLKQEMLDIQVKISKMTF